MSKIRVSDYIVQHLEQIGVGHVFMLSGGGMMHLIDAVGRSGKLKYVCGHHEQSCAFAADGYARQSQGLSVCYATSGPGATNTVSGVVSSYQDSTPILFISGQAKTTETIRHTESFGLRQFGTFEVDILPIIQSVTKYSVFLNEPSMIRYHLEKAIAIALSGRPGPVFIDIPVDVQGALVDPAQLKGFDEKLPTDPSVTPAQLDYVISKIRESKRPLIFAGHGVRCSKEIELFRSVISQLNVPVVISQLGKDVLEYEHELFVGHPGVKGDRPGGFAVQSADLIITLGCSLHSMTTGYELDQFAPKAHKIQIDLDEKVLAREAVGVHYKINSSVQNFLLKLKARLTQELGTESKLFAMTGWHERCRIWKRELSVRNEAHRHPEGKLNYYDALFAISDACKGGETVIADAGSAFYATGQAFPVKKDQRFILCGALAQMGYTLPAVVGACAADSSRCVIGITGDGSFQTAVHDLAVMRYHNMNAKIFIVNNDGYVSIRNTQNNYFQGLLVGTDAESGLFLPQVEKVANAYEIPYFYAETQANLLKVIKAALDAKGPVICEIRTAYKQEIIPSVSSVRLENGKMLSKPLDEMYPFMDASQISKYKSDSTE